MRARKKTGGKDFQKGQSGNPNGRPPLALEIREFRSAAKAEIIEEFKYLWSLPIKDLQKVAGVFKSRYDDDYADPIEEFDQEELQEQPAIRVALAKALLNAAKDGNMFNIDRILDRVIGRVKEEVDLNHGGLINIHSKIIDLIEKLDDPESMEVNHGKENSQSKSDKKVA